MAFMAKRIGAAVSNDARARLAAIKAAPTLDTWRNPLTRSIARHFTHEAWTKTLKEIDFEYRLTEQEIDGVSCLRYEADRLDRTAPLILAIHGGGFIAGSAHTHAALTLAACHLTGAEGIGLNYSLLPDAQFPTPAQELDRVYQSLVAVGAHQKIILLADGVGAGLALAAMMRWRDQGAPAPAGAIFLAPCIDAAAASDSHIALEDKDPVTHTLGGKYFRELFRYYAPGLSLKGPAISPIYGDFTWLPPLLIHVGGRDVLLGDAARLAEAARQAGVKVSLRVFDGMFHLFHMHWKLDETRIAYGDIADFIMNA